MSRGLLFTFGEFVLDAANRRLLRAGSPVKVRDKSLDVLEDLVRHAGELRSRRAIIDSVWPDVAVQDGVLSVSVLEIRRALGDDPKAPRFLETVHRQGFRFIAEVYVVATPGAAASVDRAAEATHQMPVGRDREIGILTGLLGEEQNGGPRAVLLHGAAGIGKTRLLQELGVLGQREDWLVLRARASDVSQQSSFWIWSQLLSDLFEQTRDARIPLPSTSVIADVAAIVPSLRRYFPEIPDTSGRDPEVARSRFFDATVALLRNASRTRSVVVLLDDVHRATTSSLALLRAVFDGLDGERLVIGGTWRTSGAGASPNSDLARTLEDSGAAFRELAAAWLTEPKVRFVEVGPLEKEQIGELVKRERGTALGPDLLRRIHEDSRGNPYFALRLASEAVAYAEGCGDAGEQMLILEPATFALYSAGRLDRIIELERLFDEAATKCGRIAKIITASGYLTISLQERGRFRETEQVARRIVERLREVPAGETPRFAWRFGLTLAATRERFDEVGAYLDSVDALGPAADAILMPLELAFARLQQQQRAGVSDGLEQILHTIGERAPGYPWHWALPYFLMASGKRHEAADELGRLAANGFADLPPAHPVFCWLGVVTSLGDACAEVGDAEMAKRLWALLEPYADQWACFWGGAANLGPIARVLGRLARLRGDERRAQTHFAYAAEACRREGMAHALAIVDDERLRR